ncbi:hypothetical protein [Embleya sp. NPDC005971]|uniref:hypothetical protein n=1 Tax=unclassified Embleya TaxID=2699296 RepID=UPI0033DFBE36
MTTPNTPDSPSVIVMAMSPSDFSRLCQDGQPWRTAAPHDPHRFVVVDDAPELADHWARAYWVGDNWISVMLIRSYLEARGHKFQIVHDDTDITHAGYVVLTNYYIADAG